MKKSLAIDFAYYLIAPVVAGLIVFAFWLVVQSSIENYKLGSLVDQVFRIVDLSREMKVSKDETSQRAQDVFFERLKRAGGDNLLVLPPDGIGQPAARGLENPWGQATRVFFYPSYQAIRIESPVSASVCRRLISLYKKDVADLGLQRVDVRSVGLRELWRKIYEARDKERAIIPDTAIYSGCGMVGDVVVSLTFSL